MTQEEISEINRVLDQHLTETGKQSTNPVEANAILAEKGILRNSKSRPGEPLRKLLKKGVFSHAFQSAGKGSHWIIPHSSNINPIVPQSDNKTNAILQKQNVSMKNDINDLKRKLEDARLKYKPDKIEYLLIAEAPPDNIERFFYYEDVRKHDYLFLAIVEALYPDQKEKFLSSGRCSHMKELILCKLKTDGFYLLDLSELPIKFLNNDLSEQLPSLVKRINDVVDKQTNIILIKATVYDAAFLYLHDKGFNIVDIKIPFPSSGRQNEFQTKFREALTCTEKFFA